MQPHRRRRARHDVSGKSRKAGDGVLIHLVFAQLGDLSVVARLNILQEFFNGTILHEVCVGAAFLNAAHVL